MEKFLAFIRTLPCRNCGDPSVAHHERKNIPWEYKGGVGIKPHDLMAWPLCIRCHELYHRNPKALNVNPQTEIIRCLVKYILELEK